MKYRRKPVVVDAWQNNNKNIPNWLSKYVISDKKSDVIILNTPNGMITLYNNDYVILDHTGRFFTYNPIMFENLYEEI